MTNRHGSEVSFTSRNLRDKMVLAEGLAYDMDDRKTRVNNNVLIVGTTGGGKTRSIVSPNLLQAEGSYIISDPKGNLYGRYAGYLRKKGYRVHKLNLTDPYDGKTCGYNFFHYIRNERDVLKVAHMITYNDKASGTRGNIDPFWDEAGELLLVALIGYIHVTCGEKHQNLMNLMSLLNMISIDEFDRDEKSPLDLLMEDANALFPMDMRYYYNSYVRFRQAAERTLRSILITVSSKLAVFDSNANRLLFDRDDILLEQVGEEKTAIFVVISDTDRSMDRMANMFFTQAMNELCLAADKHPDCRLPVPVRFILDDFATSVTIMDFPRMIASIRSRGISAMLVIQSEAQLDTAYHSDRNTIIGNCDTYVYLGGSDLGTAKCVAEKLNIPVQDVLYMPVGESWIFRRGERPVHGTCIDLEQFQRIKGYREERVIE